MKDMKSTLQFLRALSNNNDRDWFNAHKDTYLQAKGRFEELVYRVWKEIVRFDPTLAGLDVKKFPFRIYRDVRFSRDKRPYKVNMGAAFSPNGKMAQEPGYYMHIEPGDKSFVAGGMYMPDSGNLQKIRQEIDYNFDAFNGVLRGRSFASWYERLNDGQKLKTAPKGYPKDHPHIDFLRHKSFTASHAFSDKEVMDTTFVKRVARAFEAIKPLNDFLRHAIA